MSSCVQGLVIHLGLTTDAFTPSMWSTSPACLLGNTCTGHTLVTDADLCISACFSGSDLSSTLLANCSSDGICWTAIVTGVNGSHPSVDSIFVRRLQSCLILSDNAGVDGRSFIFANNNAISSKTCAIWLCRTISSFTACEKLTTDRVTHNWQRHRSTECSNP